MERLLISETAFFEREGASWLIRLRVKRSHRRLYREYLRSLAKEVRLMRKQTADSMASTEEWSSPLLFQMVAISEFALVRLRWLSVRSALGLPVNDAAVSRSLDRLLSGRISEPAAT